MVAGRQPGERLLDGGDDQLIVGFAVFARVKGPGDVERGDDLGEQDRVVQRECGADGIAAVRAGAGQLAGAGQRADEAKHQLQAAPGRGCAGLVEAGDGVLVEPDRLVVGEPLLGLLGGEAQVAGRLGGVGAGFGEVVGKGRDLARVMPFDGLGGAGVQPGAAQPGQAVVEGVADQGVGEPDPACAGFGHQAGEQPGLDRVQQHVLLGAGDVGEHVSVGLGADHRCLPQDGLGGGREPGDPALQDFAHSGGYLGGCRERAFGVEQPGGLLDEERVAAGPLGDAARRFPVDGAGAGRLDQLARRGRIQPAQVYPGRLARSQCCQAGRQLLAGLGRPVGGQYENPGRGQVAR